MSYASSIPGPLAPYSAASDPGPYHSPWSHTPTNPYGVVNFHFPKSQEQLVANAQGSIAQLSTLTKFLCDEPSVFTPISARYKKEKIFFLICIVIYFFLIHLDLKQKYKSHIIIETHHLYRHVKFVDSNLTHGKCKRHF